MKMIVAIIQPTKLDALEHALANIGVTRMTVCDAMGFGRQRGQMPMYRGQEYKTDFLRKVQLEIAVNDDFLEKALDVISEIARTGPDGIIGDGKVFVLPMSDAIQLGATTRGQEAI